MKRPELVGTVVTLEQLDEKLKDGLYLFGRQEPRIAMIGRSNVGKSTLINLLTESKMARTSQTPGKTRELNVYTWPQTKRLVVDLPGYGYANVPAKIREHWRVLIERYLTEDQKLSVVLHLVDSRHGILENDAQAIAFTRNLNIKKGIVFTKFDKMKSKPEQQKAVNKAAKDLAKFGYTTDEAFFVSSHKPESLVELKEALL